MFEWEIMLVLTRKESEALMIGEDVKITILSVKGGQVRLGIEAPKNVSIQRTELLETPENSPQQKVAT